MSGLRQQQFHRERLLQQQQKERLLQQQQKQRMVVPESATACADQLSKFCRNVESIEKYININFPSYLLNFSLNCLQKTIYIQI